MKVHLTKNIINDLKKNNNLKIFQRFFDKVFDSKGSWKNFDKDDHQFKGQKNSWIRYLSKSAGYRLIYTKKDGDIFLLRVGEHDKAERKFNSNINFSESVEVSENHNFVVDNNSSYNFINDGNLNFNHFTLGGFGSTLYSNEFKRIFSGIYQEIYIIAPYMNDNLFIDGTFGLFLRKQMMNDAKVTVVTQHVKDIERLKFFKFLEDKGIEFYFLKHLHSKLYIFELNFELSERSTFNPRDTFILGSANFTTKGLDLDNESNSNHEIGINLPISYRESIIRYKNFLLQKSINFNSMFKIAQEIKKRNEYAQKAKIRNEK